MKIGDRVRFSSNQKSSLVRAQRGTVIVLGDGYVTVRWDTGPTISHDADVLMLAEPFPYRSHRTMREVLDDEQEPVPA